MKLTILGGGGFRVPLIYQQLLTQEDGPDVREVVLYDLASHRLNAVHAVLDQLAAGRTDAPKVRTATDLDEALDGADFVFSAIRVDGLAGRTVDERVALDLGILGQETTGPGGLAYALRTIPVCLDIADRVARHAPNAWVINFTNPAGMVTEAMRRRLGDRVIGICDSPIGLGVRAARVLGVDQRRVALDYVGLNHLGWLRGLRVDGVDRLPELLADDTLLSQMEEARLLGLEWVRSLGAIPNEYLYYYYYNRDAVSSIKDAATTRGEFLHQQQDQFYAEVAGKPDTALEIWTRTRAEREATYMAESRDSSGAGEREQEDIAEGGYQKVALDLMAGIVGGHASTMILNVRNGSAVPGLPADAVVEVPCLVDGTGARPFATEPLQGHMLGLVQQVKAVEQLTIEAAASGSASLAVKALALHPLVDSVTTARRLLAGYRERLPGLADVLR
ncbi:6-phospho-beta-glucosidase [Micromonospora coriariae]|uniref:6-phospho-beta-glucosidase n=1 Tax=Micromonospora coriariae TaxID=285665 RepID=A0A1C4U6Z2_9ACTN|nr:6-phospho-beta-glucosidase [Micromonospora coriariae]SCE67367.1 6-phospho-beta-glucosidase [Micromonospora coriariae]